MGMVASHDMFQTSVSGFWRVLSAPLERTACHHRFGDVTYQEVPMRRCPWRGESGVPYREVPMPRRPWRGESGAFRPFALSLPPTTGSWC